MQVKQAKPQQQANPANGGEPYASDGSRWAAVAARDVAADGHFVFAVRTTGIYCRPGCPSRTALRDNVVFYRDADAAAQAGFRPCKRCKPDQQSLVARQQRSIEAACRMIEGADGPITLDALAAAQGMSTWHFHRLFKQSTGVTPRAYAKAVRAERARRQLQQSPTVTAALFDAGFNSSTSFYAAARDALGMAPARFRDGGAGETIRFALGQCSLGAILVAATDNGICAIALDDTPEPLLQQLQDRFPKADLRGGDAAFEQWVARVIGLVEAPGMAFDLPLDIRGTAFQQRVWQALRAIPSGTTLSYSELAARLGMPSAVRAVASACAANTIALAIPCHRVVRNDGSLSGYRWGVARKRALIDREAQP